ncbi:hypothetical protein AALO_G00181910 [Alosa alosa]|uniref:Uncharacterized protein n=1 Tax=Alosa alosa TaxID=278164 RepID=A0AAV6GCM2_9TELE|nr:hypothetical protein AALO_G00181910 [Alosa alosa]
MSEEASVHFPSNEPAGETEDASVSLDLAGVDAGADQVVKPAPHSDHDYAELSVTGRAARSSTEGDCPPYAGEYHPQGILFQLEAKMIKSS